MDDTPVILMQWFQGRRLSGRLIHRNHWPGLLAVTALATAYLVTLQRDVPGSTHPYLFDVGEMQLALNLWGTLHTTGYPLYAMTGAALVALQRWLGATPAAAASGVSFLWSVVSLPVTYALFLRRTRQPLLAAALVLVLGTLRVSWLYSVVAEVYSLYFLLVALILWFSFDDGNQEWERRDWLILALLLGLGIGHHRAVLFLLPPLMIYLWMPFWQARHHMALTLLLCGLLAAATFLVYLYLPLRALMGGRWIYGDPTSWSGFWFQFFAGEAGWTARPPDSLAELSANAIDVAGLLADELTWPGLALGVASLIGVFLVPGHRRYALALSVGVATIYGLVTLLPAFVLYDVGLMPVPLLMLLAFAEVAAYIAHRHKPIAWLAPLAVTALAVWLFTTNLPFILTHTRDEAGRRTVEGMQRLELAADDTLAAPWGPRFFAMSYAREVTGEFVGPPIVDHNADFEAILSRGGRLIVPADAFYVLPPSWWGERGGARPYLRSAGPGFVEIDDEPLVQWPSDPVITLDNGVSLLGSELVPDGPERYVLSLYWRADELPTTNYSVFVHVVGRESGELLAQFDSFAPVAGWYPVTDWEPGEIVRDEYLVQAPASDKPLALEVGMYRPLDDGSFYQLDALRLPLTD